MLKLPNQGTYKLQSLSAKQKKYKSGTGFGTKKVESEPIEDDSNASLNVENSEVAPKELLESNEESINTSSMSTDDIIKSTSMYKKARQRQEMELDEKIQKLQQQEIEQAADPSVGAVPELIANRMITRIAWFLGIPLFGGLSIFVAAFFAVKKYDISIEPSVVAYATQVPFVIGLLGISYAIISTSWDEEEGSALGMSEFKLNFSRIKDGLSRSKDTARLKEEIERESEKLGRK